MPDKRFPENSCARSWDCRIDDNGLCRGEHETCHKDKRTPIKQGWDTVSTRASLRDPNNLTAFCEMALSDQCPYEKRVLCLKASHDICLTGKFEESDEGRLQKIEDKIKRDYRPENPHAKFALLVHGHRSCAVDIGG